MSVRNLDSLFDPASVAVIGASKRPSSVGATVWHNLAHGGFAGPLYPVIPTTRTRRAHRRRRQCGRLAASARVGRDLHPRCQRGRPGAGAGRAGHTRRHRFDRGLKRRAKSGHAGSGPTAPAAPVGAQLHWAVVVARQAQRQLCPHLDAEYFSRPINFVTWLKDAITRQMKTLFEYLLDGSNPITLAMRYKGGDIVGLLMVANWHFRARTLLGIHR